MEKKFNTPDNQAKTPHTSLPSLSKDKFFSEIFKTLALDEQPIPFDQRLQPLQMDHVLIHVSIGESGLYPNFLAVTK